MKNKELIKRTAVICYADASKYTLLTREDEDGTHSVLKYELERLTQIVKDYGGTNLGFAGDSLLSEFPTIKSSVEAALEFQRREEKWADDEQVIRLRFRIGINFGDVIEDKGNIYGDGVNLAERLHRLADPGEICVSEAMYRALESTSSWHFHDIGKHSVHNVKQPIRAYIVSERSLTRRQSRIAVTTTQLDYLIAMSVRILEFSTLANATDLEKMSETTEHITSRFELIVGHFGGTPQIGTNGRLHALFGTPKSFGDDAERAIQAALDFERFLTESELQTSVRIGLDIGPVLVSNIKGREKQAVGAPLINADLIVSAFDSPGIWVSRILRGALPPSFEFDAQQKIIKRDQRQPIWKLLNYKPTHIPDRNFVGRKRELGLLRHLLSDCFSNGKGATIQISGEAGLGKSSLLSQFLNLADEFSCMSCFGVIRDFGAIRGRDALRMIFFRLLSTEEFVVERSDQAIRAIESRWPNSIIGSLLCEIIGLPQGNEGVHEIEITDLAVQTKDRREAIIALLEEATEKRPVIIAVEDIHWADTFVLSVLEVFFEASQNFPLLVVFTSREQNNISNRHPIINFQLSHLSIQESKELARETVRSVEDEEKKRLDAERVASCVQRAGGHPFFLVNLIRNDSAETTHELPPTIMSAIRHRFDGLSEGELSVLQSASVAGQKSEWDLVRYIMGSQDADISRLVDRRLLKADHDNCVFEHSLIRDAMYSLLLPSRKQHLHKKAAEYYELLQHDLPTLAEHLMSAGDKRAADAFFAAARAEARQYRNDNAITLASRGLELIPEDDNQNRIKLGLFLGKTQALNGDLVKSSDSLKAALELGTDEDEIPQIEVQLAANAAGCDRYEDALKLLDSAISKISSTGDHEKLANAYRERGNVYFALGKIKECSNSHNAAHKHAETSRDPTTLIQTYGGMGDAEYALGRMRRARDYFERCVEMATAHGMLHLRGANEHMLPTCGHYFRNLASVVSECEAALEIARSGSHRRGQLCCFSVLSVVHFDRGDSAAALEAAESAESLARTLHLARFRPLNLTYMAKVCRVGHQIAKAREYIDEALLLSRQLGMNYNGPRILAEKALLSDNVDSKKRALDEGKEILSGGCIGSGHLWFHRDAIEVSLGIGELESAEEHMDALERYSLADDLTWAKLICARGRTLIKYSGDADVSSKHEELKALMSAATNYGFGSLVDNIKQDLLQQ